MLKKITIIFIRMMIAIVSLYFMNIIGYAIPISLFNISIISLFGRLGVVAVFILNTVNNF